MINNSYANIEQMKYANIEQIKIGRTYVSNLLNLNLKYLKIRHSRLPENAFASTRTAKNVH